MTQALAALCRHVGVAASYRGFTGETVTVHPETQAAVLRALELEVTSEADARAVLHDLEAVAAARPLPPEIIVTAGRASGTAVTAPCEWALLAEDTGAELARGRAETALDLPALPMGLHTLHVTTGRAETTTAVLARPARAFGLSDRVPEARIWGVLAALYGMTDGAAAALGSYDLLGAYAEALAAHGADFVGINPIHAMGAHRPGDVISPYSPSHRGFLNTWHMGAPAPGSNAPLIDYQAALAAHEKALRHAHDSFARLPHSAPDQRAFADFVAAGGTALHSFATFEALTARFGADWRAWPADYHDPASVSVRSFAQAHGAEIAQTLWAQWRADADLRRAQDRAVQAGMRIGLYLDLAVGPRLGGAETWGRDTGLVTGATLGAPPDPLGPLGQSWGLAPQSPLRLRAQGYRGFARLLRAAMRPAGMIRIDHVLGLMRSFWIPEGGTAGTYVAYPFDALLAVVAIESQRARSIVVGEDLGLVPEGLREKLAAAGIYGLDVMQYMRTEAGGFIAPAETRAKAVFAFATHDTPTIAGFFAAEDARARLGFGGLDARGLAETKADRQRAADSLASQSPVAEIHQRLAASASEMVAVQLDDIAQSTAQQNLPGTIDEHPNWRRKAPFTVQQIAASPACARLGADMAAQGRSNTRNME